MALEEKPENVQGRLGLLQSFPMFSKKRPRTQQQRWEAEQPSPSPLYSASSQLRRSASHRRPAPDPSSVNPDSLQMQNWYVNWQLRPTRACSGTQRCPLPGARRRSAPNAVQQGCSAHAHARLPYALAFGCRAVSVGSSGEMAGRSMQAARCPTDELSLSNCAVVNEKDFQAGLHVVVRTSPNHRYIFTLRTHSSVVPGSIAFSLPQRKWAGLSIGQDIDVSPYTFDKTKQCIGTMTIEIDFLQKKSIDANPYDTDKMAAEFIQQFNSLAFSVGQQLVFSFNDKLFGLLVKDIEGMDPSILKGEPGTSKKQKIDVGLVVGNSQVAFEKAENSSLNLIGKSKTKENRQSIINPDWNFEKMGIGGLDREFSDIFRRAFASRVFPPELVEQMGCKHLGANSGLHIIIFDEIDAICKQRGSMMGSTGVHDTVVNQLLSKIDGVEQLNNILVIGMTNRPDLIDEALLRPGRLEVKMEIGLPDEKGRLQILHIHTARMREHELLSEDVDVKELSVETKNFSGAELEGLVRAAQSTAMNRHIKTDVISMPVLLGIEPYTGHVFYLPVLCMLVFLYEDLQVHVCKLHLLEQSMRITSDPE
ncbi:coiled-coil domain-containing protein 77 [Platysternon megacephalum]|uniref:Vesicle-fusing ATPase n=1 Tax=Platysternon megacephalum TaxID=55544 RepID=A0A4D9DYL1_9SAUR|nr:coiled-coil domain-containing protein 77 [Platysternon megacephalum]